MATNATEREERLNFVKAYLENNLTKDSLYSAAEENKFPFDLYKEPSKTSSYMTPMQTKEFNTYIHRMVEQNKSFKEALFDFIEEKGLTYPECYHKALVSKSTASKIKNDPTYKPSKPTAISFAIALKLSIEETQFLLETLGLCLSTSLEFDMAIRALMTQKCYDIYQINETLYDLGLDILGISNEAEA